MDDNALGQRDYDSEDEMDQNSAPLDIQAEDMFPSLQSATSGATAPASPPLPQGSDGPSLTAATTYPSTEDAVANLTMNFARAVALQPMPAATTRPLGNGSYGLDSTRRMPPPPPVHRPLYHKAGSSEGIGTKWVSTGQSVATQYLELREQAYEMACARNKCFMGATQAYRNGNKALAKGLSKQGHEYNAKMKNFHFLAASEIFESRNPPNQLYMDRMMDLHGLHVAEAVEFLTQMLPKLADEGVDSIYLVTGSGHHSKGPDGNARLLPAVERFLADEGYQYTPVADGAGGGSEAFTTTVAQPSAHTYTFFAVYYRVNYRQAVGPVVQEARLSAASGNDPPPTLVHLLDVLVHHVLEAVGLEDVDVADAAAVGVAVRGVVDGALAELDGLVVRQVPAPVGVQHAVGVRGAGADAELGHVLAGRDARALVVHVVEHGLAVVVAHHHHAQRHAVALVVVARVGDELRGGAHRDAVAVAQLVHAALHGQVALPELAVGGAAGQRGQDVLVDGVHLLQNVLSSSSANVATLCDFCRDLPAGVYIVSAGQDGLGHCFVLVKRRPDSRVIALDNFKAGKDPPMDVLPLSDQLWIQHVKWMTRVELKPGYKCRHGKRKSKTQRKRE
ncbi:hypothetical protein ON010_g1522 [Phytophthora cinnamomi]|nr:hypothetical protein ON010_g1522 [Phytophthora cinnamomi]